MSKNKQYKQYKANGGTLTFAEWIRSDLNNEVQQTVAQYKNASGYCAAANNYQPCITGNTVLGVNKYLIFAGVAIAIGAIAYGVYQNRKGRVAVAAVK